MKKNLFTLTLFIIFNLLTHAQNQNLNLLLIPDSLSIDANAIIRYDHTDIELLNSSKMIIKKKNGVTILNKYGDEDGHVYLNYDNHSKIKTGEL